MICVVLAAGYATRLYPLTENFPKPLLPVCDKPILNWLLDDIDTFPEITAHVIISNHKFIRHFQDWQPRQCYTRPITLLDDGSTDNDNRLGAVKDIQFVMDTLKTKDDFLVVAGDNLVDFSMAGFIKFAENKGTSCVMYHEENELEKQQRTAIITKNADDLITSYAEKPTVPISNMAVPPFYCFRAEDTCRIAEAIADGCHTDAPGSFAAWLSQNTALHAWKMPGNRYDIGDLASYRFARTAFASLDA